MESIKKDLARLSLMKQDEDTGRKHTLMEIVGNDVDSSYSDPLTYQVSSSQDIISVGGMSNLGQNTQIQIQLYDDSALHMMDRYMIVGECQVIDGYIQNALHLFEPVQCDIGSYSIAYTNGRFYCQQKYTTLKQNEQDKICNANWTYQHQLIAPANTVYGDYETALQGNFAARQNGPLNTLSNICRFAVRLVDIFPFLKKIPDHVLYSGLGQKIKFNIRTTQYTDCIVTKVADSTYTLNRIQLVRCYAKLDPIRNDLILKSAVQLPIHKYIWWGNTLSNSPTVQNAIYNVGHKDRIKGLYFAYHSIYNPANIVDCAAVGANTENIIQIPNGGGAMCRLQYPMSSFPLPISQISVDVGGRVYNINLQQLQFFHITHSEMDKNELYKNPIQRVFNHVYYVDMTRFNDDLLGSSSKDITTVRVQIQLTEGIKTIPGQHSVWTSAALDKNIASLQPYQFQSFLECQQMIDLNHGLYQ